MLRYEDQHFIEPPHKHDQKDIAILIFRPIEINETSDAETKVFFEAFYTATSIAYASLRRERELYTEFVESRDIRKTPSCRDYLKVNIARRMQAECFYFEDEVMPDWRHKAFHLQFQCADKKSKVCLNAWLITTKGIVERWQDEFQQMSAAITV